MRDSSSGVDDGVAYFYKSKGTAEIRKCNKCNKGAERWDDHPAMITKRLVGRLACDMAENEEE